MKEHSPSTKLLEADIKAKTLNYLRCKNIIDNKSIIMNELTIGNFKRRVDLAIYTNGRLIAFEIKSEADSLTRLEGQVNTYLDYFDKVIVISDKKFTSKIIEKSPKSVGVWEVSSEMISIKSKGSFKNKIDNEKLLTFMDVVDLKKLSTRLKIPSEKHRTALESSLVSVSNSNLRLGVEQSLKRKFEDVTKTFNEETSCKSISKKDLKTLSRFSEQREVEKKKLKQKVEFWNNIDQHVSDLSHFLKSATSA